MEYKLQYRQKRRKRHDKTGLFLWKEERENEKRQKKEKINKRLMLSNRSFIIQGLGQIKGQRQNTKCWNKDQEI